MSLGKGKTNSAGIELTAEQREWLGEVIVSGKETPLTASLRFYLPVRGLGKYAEKVRKGLIFADSAGRPTVLDANSKIAYAEFLTDNTYQRTTEEVNEFVQELAVKTAETRGVHSINAPIVSKRTIERLEAESKTITKNSEAVTAARQIATSDVRNAITFGGMNAMMVEYSIPQLIVNMDSTQFCVGYNNNKKLEIKFIGEVNGPLKSNPSKDRNSNGLAYFIKVYIVITAFGNQAPPVYVVADDNMTEKRL